MGFMLMLLFPNIRKFFSFLSLEKYWRKYQYASRFVQLVRSKSPKITYFTRYAKCVLMENSPGADFEVWFYDGKCHLEMVIFFPLQFVTQQLWVYLFIFFNLTQLVLCVSVSIHKNYTTQYTLCHMLIKIYLSILSYKQFILLIYILILFSHLAPI